MKKVFINGTFDILHLGHIAMFEYAKSLGDLLIVGIASDELIKSLKGDTYPITNQYERGTLVASFRDVDEVYVYENEQDLVDLMMECDIIVKDTKHKIDYIEGKEIVYFGRIDGYSSTAKIEHIINR